MDDLISRQAAIDTIEDFPHGDVWNVESMEEMVDRIKQLPPIQPVNCSEFPNNSDTISRRAAIDALRTCYDTETITMDNGDEYINYGDAVGEIEQLPPIQSKLLQPWEVLVAQAVLPQSAEPKTGKWILDRSGAYCCSECMEPCAGYVMMKPRDKFCKMCGAKMEVNNEIN